MVDSVRGALSEGLEALALAADAHQVEQLLGYLELLQRWNRTYNLTAVRDPLQMVSHHLLDSLAALPLIERSALVGRRSAAPFRLFDVGSGAGLPSIPLAILRPEWQVRSVDAVDKKIAFQRQVKIELKLANLDPTCARVESLPPSDADLVISRAFASMADFATGAGHLLGTEGWLCAMKGVVPEDEIANLPSRWQVESIAPLHVPGLAAERHLLFLRKH